VQYDGSNRTQVIRENCRFCDSPLGKLWIQNFFFGSVLFKKQKILDKKKFDSVLVMSGRRENVENCISVLGYVLVNLV